MKNTEKLKRLCEQGGIRLTLQRLEIFREITAARDHPSVEELYERLKRRLPTISLDTVYRTLTTFEQLGLVRRVHTPEPITRFDPDSSQHHHLFCRMCGTIIDFRWPELDALELPDEIKKAGEVENRQIQLFGVCKECIEGGKEK